MERSSRAHDRGQAAEIARIETAYKLRDASSSATYSFANPGYAFYLQALEWSLLETLRRAPVRLTEARVLDVGCGGGYFLQRLVEYGAADATGVDLMPDRIELARRRYPGLRFECANAAELPFADQSFDLVTQFTCLSSVLDPQLRAAIGAEIMRMLRPGGVLVSYDMRPAPAPIRIMRWAGERRRRRTGAPTGQPTVTVGIDAGELGRIFPRTQIHYASAALGFGLCGIAGRSYLAARLLAALPPLREHGIAVVVKQPTTGDRGLSSEPAGVDRDR